MHALAFAAALGMLLIGHQDPDRDKLRALIVMPALSVEVKFQYVHLMGYEMASGSGDDDDTPEKLRAKLHGGPDDATFYYRLGNVYDFLKNETEARSAWQKAAELDRDALKATPNDGARLARLMLALHQLGRHEESEKAFADAQARAPKSGAVWDARADARIADALSAMSGMHQSLQSSLAPQTLESILTKTRDANAAKQALVLLGEAKVAYDRAITADPDSYKPYAERFLYRATVLFDRSLLQRVADGKPASATETADAEQQFARSTLAPEAVTDLVAAADRSSDNSLAIGMAAFFTYAADVTHQNITLGSEQAAGTKALTESARKTVTRLLAKLESLGGSADKRISAHAGLSLGLVQFEMGQSKEAEATLLRAVEHDPTELRAFDVLLGVYVQARNFDAMRKAIERELPHMDTVRLRLFLAKVAAKQNDWPRAESEVRAALKDSVNDFDANLAFGAVLLHNATAADEIARAGNQLSRTISLRGADISQTQWFSLTYTAAIYDAMRGAVDEAREKVKALAGQTDEAEIASVKALSELVAAQ